MQMKKLLKNNGIECRKLRRRKVAELFSHKFMPAFSSEMRAEYFAYKRSATMSWNGSAIIRFFGMLVIIRKQQDTYGFYTGFQTSVKGHDDDIGITIQQEQQWLS